MSDSVKKYFEDILPEAGHFGNNARQIPKRMYIWVLDFTTGEVYRYDTWNPDTEACEEFLDNAGHKIQNCEWMVTKNKDVNF